jgi:hypothetical protein
MNTGAISRALTGISTRSWITGIVVAMLVSRLVLGVLFFKGNENTPYWEDVEIALNIVHGDGFSLTYGSLPYYTHSYNVPNPERTAVKAPLCPLFFGLLFDLFGVKNFVSLFVAQSILSVLTCLVLYAALSKLSLLGARIVSLAYCLYPPFIYHDVTTAEDTTLLLFALGSLIAIGIVAATSRKRYWIFCFAAASGLTSLIDPVLLPFEVITIAVLALQQSPVISNRLATIFASYTLLVCFIAPWFFRNETQFGEFVFIKSAGASTILYGLHLSGVTMPESLYVNKLPQLAPLNQPEREKVAMATMLEWFRIDPGVYLRSVPRNFVQYLFWRSKFEGRFWEYLLGRQLPYSILLVLVIIPAAWKWRLVADVMRKQSQWRVTLFMLSVLAVSLIGTYTLVGFWDDRFRFPLELAFLVLLGVLWSALSLSSATFDSRAASKN